MHVDEDCRDRRVIDDRCGNTSEPEEEEDDDDDIDNDDDDLLGGDNSVDIERLRLIAATGSTRRLPGDAVDLVQQRALLVESLGGDSPWLAEAAPEWLRSTSR